MKQAYDSSLYISLVRHAAPRLVNTGFHAAIIIYYSERLFIDRL